MRDSLVQALNKVGARQRERVALRWRDARWTYGALLDAIAGARNALAKRRGEPGTRVALLIRNCPQYVAVFYGALDAGYAVVPLNTQERASTLARQIEHSGAKLVIGDAQHPEWQALQAAVRHLDVEAIGLEITDALDASSKLAQALGDDGTVAAPSAVTRDQLAAIIYTSGTTGHPKGVMLSHGNLAANAASIIESLSLTEADRGLCVLPFHFSYGNSVLHTHLLTGAELIIEDNFAFPHLILQRIQSEQVTGFAGVPSTFALLLGRCRLGDYDLSCLRYVTQAGGAMALPLIERLRDQAPGVSIFIMYGQTEATARLTCLPSAKLDAKLGSVGVPIRDVEIEVRGSDRQPLGPDEIGEIHARGPNIMLGYWNDPQATAQVLNDGWLRTGDLGRRDAEGYLYIHGRAVEMIKVGAFRVSPSEVEEALAAIDGVEEVAVTGIPDDMLGQAIKAVIIPRPGAQLQALAIKAHCREHLAAYKIPKIVEFAAALPRTSSGKVQRHKLAEEIK